MLLDAPVDVVVAPYWPSGLGKRDGLSCTRQNGCLSAMEENTISNQPTKDKNAAGHEGEGRQAYSHL